MARRKPGAAPAARQVTLQPIDQLVPYARNARTHDEDQIGQIAASIREFGWTYPVLADAEGIVAGHGRVMAANLIYEAGETINMLGGEAIPPGMVPVLDCSGWSPDQRRAYILADNKIAENAGWDEDLLKTELAELEAASFNLAVLGFSEEELAQLSTLGNPGNQDPDAAPPLEEAAVAILGDVWILGKHRLVCGDATDKAAVEASFGEIKPHLMVTDPPYGVKYNPKWRDDLGTDWVGQQQKKTQRLSTHKSAWPIIPRSLGKVQNDDRADWREAWALFPGNIAYVWHGGLHSGIVQASLEAVGLHMRAQIIWAKQHFVFSRGDYHWQHEPCWYAVRGTGKWTGDRKQSTVWDIPNAGAFKGEKDDGVTGHGTQKPVECMKRPIENNSRPGDGVYDPFCGSGTTIIAGEMTGRRVSSVELDPRYVDVAVKRWQQFTGEEAILEATGESWANVAKTRTPAPQAAE